MNWSCSRSASRSISFLLGRRPYVRSISFLVGGTTYDVPEALLDRFPQSKLAQLAAADKHGPSSHRDIRLQSAQDSSGKYIDPEISRKATASNRDPISINRDGGRFTYILDYMRNGKVILPYKSSVVTKESLLTEFGFYGFDNTNHVLSNAIQVSPFPANESGFSVVDSVEYLYSLEQRHQVRVKEMEQEQEDLKYKRKCLDLALHMFQKYKNSKKL